MLRLHIKNTLRSHTISILSIFLLIVCASVSMNFSLFSYMDAKENTLIEAYDAGTYAVTLSEQFDDIFSEKCSAFNETLSGLKRIELIPESPEPLVALFSGKPDGAVSEGTIGNVSKETGTIVIGRSTCALGTKNGDTVERLGKSYRVCGVCPPQEFDFIYANGLPQGAEIKEIRLIFNNTFSVRNSGVITSEIQKQFSECEITEPENLDELDGILFQIRMAIIISVIAAIDILFVFGFLLDKQKHSLQIFRICGMYRKQLAAVLFSELLSVALMGIFLGDLLFFACFKSLFSTIKIWWFSGSALSSLICFVICLLFTVPSILTFVFKKLNMEDV